MNVGERMGLMTVLPSVHPVDSAGALVAGTYISLKNHQRCTVLVSLGAVGTPTITIQLQQATNVAGAGVKNLLFDHVWRLGAKVFHGVTTGVFVVGEVVTAVGGVGATGLIHEIHGSHLIIYEIVGTFTIGDTLTGAGGATTVATTAALEYGLNCRVPMAAAAAVIALTVADETYEIEIDGSDLDVNNGFDCMVAQVSASGGVNLVSISYLLSQARYKEQPQKSAYQD